MPGVIPRNKGGSLLGTALSFLPVGNFVKLIRNIPVVGDLLGKVPVVGNLLGGDIAGTLSGVAELLGIKGQSVLGSFTKLPEGFKYSSGIEAHRGGSNAVAARGDAYLVVDKNANFPAAVWRWKLGKMDNLAGLTTEGYCVWDHYDEAEKALLIGREAPYKYTGKKAAQMNDKAADWAERAASLGVAGGSEAGFLRSLTSWFNCVFGW